MKNQYVLSFLVGVLATIGMSVPMILATVAGVAPMPEPIPRAIAKSILGPATALPAIMALAVISHLAYGGFWAAVLRSIASITWKSGLLLGIALWLLMQVLVLPWLGWGFFGIAITPKIAVATLVLHLIYGALVGWLGKIMIRN